MSLERAPQHQPTVLTEPTQYATYTESPLNPRSFDTMASPTPSDTLASRLSVYSLQVPQAWESPIAGAGAGFASGIVTCPLDVIKTKLQAQGGFKRKTSGSISAQPHVVYRGMIGTARTIMKEDGVRGLYRGLGPMLLGYLPTWAVYLTVYDRMRQPYYEMCENWWLARCYASLTAGACSTVITNPIWVIKTRLMSQSTRGTTDGMRAGFHYTGTWDAARKMYHAEGLRSFYSGLTPALLGLTHVAVQFPLYEFFKMHFTGYGIGEHPPDDSGSNWVGISAATFLSKTCASTATYPHEVLRTRMQTQQRSYMTGSSDGMSVNKSRHRGMWYITKSMLKEEGWRGFYVGLGTNLVRAIPSAMTTMLTYEWLQRFMHDMKSEGERIVKERNASTI